MQVTEDRKLLIAVGRSRKAVLWQNKEILWSELLDKLSNTTRTRETTAEYARISKAERDEIKDIGGFVGGYLKNGKRSNSSIVNRCLVCLDADSGDEELRSDLELACPFTYALYSTHSHTPEKPRFRIVIPLDRDVTPDEYAAISRRLADNLTLSRFDPTTFEPARLMYWPSTPEDGIFVFDYGPGPFCCADEVLSTYADWRDSSLWPTAQPMDERVHSSIKKAEDPQAKHGLIGAFCRAHSISNLLDTVLKDKYTPTRQEDRYTYVNGTTTGGLVVYDDKFAFSHHATDPASGKLCNAFDLVRWHFFAPGTVSVYGYTVKDEKTSVSMMQEYASNDPATKLQLAKDRRDELISDFGPLADEPPVSDPPNPPNTPPSGNATAADPDAWMTKLEYDKSGSVKNTLMNLLTILQNDPLLKGIVFNQLSDGMEIRDDIAPVPWNHPSKFWRDADDNQVISYVEQRYGSFSNRNYLIAISKVADDRSYHPIKEYLASLPPWDGAPRVDTLLIDYLGSPDNAYVRTVTRKTLVAAVRRIEHPGCKHDAMLVLSGPQGIGKSTLISRLGGEWFSDSLSLSDTHDKTAAEKLQGYWILEIGELAGLRKADVETLRSFLSRQNDIYRAAFGKRATPHLRQCIFFGTTNEEQGYLRDTTGNRRFWPVLTPGGGSKHSWELARDDIDQIWAEAKYLYEQGERPLLDEEVDALAKAAQREAMETDDREGLVLEYLNKLLPEDWSKMDLNVRRGFLRNDPFNGGDKEGTVLRQYVCVMEIWAECFGRDPGGIKKPDRNEILSILAKLGWKNGTSIARRTAYGIQKCFARPSDDSDASSGM